MTRHAGLRALAAAAGFVALAGLALALDDDDRTERDPQVEAPSTSSEPAAPEELPTAEVSDPAPPGRIVAAQEPMQGSDGATVHVIRYTSTDAHGARVAETGVVAVPGTTAPPEGWPLIVFAHGTTGLSDDCAPSVNPAGVAWVLATYVDAGWAVVAPDYEGLGTDAAHPYLNPTSEAHSVLDAARAAIDLDAIDVRADAPVALIGYSQGGHAVLSAAAEAADYAPELNVLGAAAAAPVTDVAAFVDHASLAEGRRVFTLAVLHSLDTAGEGGELEHVLTAEAAASLSSMDGWCAMAGVGDQIDLSGPITVTTPSTAPGWADALAALAAPSEADVAVLVVHGSDDALVPVEGTLRWVEQACADGTAVELRVVDGGTHSMVIDDAALEWFAARRAGEPASVTCD